jgi:hypothetical protein
MKLMTINKKVKVLFSRYKIVLLAIIYKSREANVEFFSAIDIKIPYH